MFNEITVLLRFLAFYVGFTLVMLLPSYIHDLLTITRSAPVIINIYGHIIYYAALTFILWFSAPWLSQKLYNSYGIGRAGDNIEIAVRVGLLLIGIKYLFERIIFLANYPINKFLNSSHSTYNKNDLLTDFFRTPELVASLISLFLIILLIINCKKIARFLTVKF